MSDIENRITDYLCSGGLCNPELAIHDRVRDLLIDCRDEIARLRLTDAEMEALTWCQRNITAMAPPLSAFEQVQAATLRGLVDRLGGDK